MIGKIRLLFWVGIVMLFMPYIGIPRAWKNILVVLLGIGIIFVSFRLRKAYKGLRFRLRRFEKLEQTTQAYNDQPVLPPQETEH